MTQDPSRGPETWSGRVGFVLANISSAVGLGSIWKFPYEVGANGGSSFLLLYLAGLLLIVLPLLLAELAIGRSGRADAIEALAGVARRAGASSAWSLCAVLGVVTGFLILSFYSVVGGWAIAFFLETLSQGLPAASGESAQRRFDELLASPARLLACHGAFMALTALVVAQGVAGGIERASRLLMPFLLVLLLGLAIHAASAGDLAAALRFFLGFDPARITARIALEALGLGFFSIGVGLSAMMTYAAYAGPNIGLRQVAWITLIGDTAISLLAGLAVFPVVFAQGIDPSGGPGLVFVALPLAFAGMPFGTVVAVIFYLLLTVAALGSAISLLELVVAPTRRLSGWSRARVSALCAGLCWLVGLATVLSFNLWADWFPLRRFGGFATATVFDLLDYATSNLMLPVAGLGIALFAGWILPSAVLGSELRLGGWRLAVLRAALRYFVPAAIAGVALGPFL